MTLDPITPVSVLETTITHPTYQDWFEGAADAEVELAPVFVASGGEVEVLVTVTTVIDGVAVVEARGSTFLPTSPQKLVNHVCSSVRSDSTVHSAVHKESGEL